LATDIIDANANGWIEARLGNLQNLLDYCRNCRKWLPEAEWKNGEIALFNRVKTTFTETWLHTETTRLKSGFVMSAENASKVQKIRAEIRAYKPKD